MSSATLPTLNTERLILRPFTVADASDVERLAGAREVADTTLHIPHPYPKGGGEAWISTHSSGWSNNTLLTLAIAPRESPAAIVGAISLAIDQPHSRAELGYWIGSEYWGQGFATEASRAMIAFAFTELGLHRVQARHFTRNPSSGRVMQKLGMQLEGVMRDAYFRWERFEDVALYAILADDAVQGKT